MCCSANRTGSGHTRPRASSVAAWVAGLAFGGAVLMRALSTSRLLQPSDATLLGMLKRGLVPMLLLASLLSPLKAEVTPETRSMLALYAGTIHCDGMRRGTAMVIDPLDVQPQQQSHRPGLFIATAAHIFYDLGSGRRFTHCHFAYRGLNQIPGYSAPIRPDWLVMGAFDPGADASDPAEGAGDWAFAFLADEVLAERVSRRMPLAARPDMSVSSVNNAYLIAWHASERRLQVSGPCDAVRSTPGDIGQGAWAGQWLDGCRDGGGGASGGGVVVLGDQGPYLLAVRTGTHWRPAHYPEGPGQNTPWDPQRYSGAARAVEGEVRAALNHLALRIVER